MSLTPLAISEAKNNDVTDENIEHSAPLSPQPVMMTFLTLLSIQLLIPGAIVSSALLNKGANPAQVHTPEAK